MSIDPISIGLLCFTGLIIYTRVSTIYDVLNPNSNKKPKIFKVQSYDNFDNELNELNEFDEFEATYNQLYNIKKTKYILVEEQDDSFDHFEYLKKIPFIKNIKKNNNNNNIKYV